MPAPSLFDTEDDRSGAATAEVEGESNDDNYYTNNKDNVQSWIKIMQILIT